MNFHIQREQLRTFGESSLGSQGERCRGNNRRHHHKGPLQSPRFICSPSKHRLNWNVRSIFWTREEKRFVRCRKPTGACLGFFLIKFYLLHIEDLVWVKIYNLSSEGTDNNRAGTGDILQDFLLYLGSQAAQLTFLSDKSEKEQLGTGTWNYINRKG